MIEVTRLKQESSEILKNLNALLVELRGESESAADEKDLKEILHNPDAVTVVAKDGNTIVGVCFLFMYQKLGKKKGWVEDVVVSGTYRGRGIGTELMKKIISIAQSEKITTLQLTSRMDRTAAHALYEKLGFEKYDTQVFRMKL